MLTLGVHKVVDIFLDAVFVEILSARPGWHWQAPKVKSGASANLSASLSCGWVFRILALLFVRRWLACWLSSVICSFHRWSSARPLALTWPFVDFFFFLVESQHFDEITSCPIDRRVISQDNSSLVKTGTRIWIEHHKTCAAGSNSKS